MVKVRLIIQNFISFITNLYSSIICKTLSDTDGQLENGSSKLINNTWYGSEGDDDGRQSVQSVEHPVSEPGLDGGDLGVLLPQQRGRGQQTHAVDEAGVRGQGARWHGPGGEGGGLQHHLAPPQQRQANLGHRGYDEMD